MSDFSLDQGVAKTTAGSKIHRARGRSGHPALLHRYRLRPRQAGRQPGDGGGPRRRSRDSAALHHLTPDIPVISEEQYSAGKSPAGDHDTFWLVDPLDGTRSFVEHTDEFTVNIGLVSNGVPILGVMYLPVEGDLYAAAGPGTAVHCVQGRTDVHISARTIPADGLVCLSSRSHGDRAKLDAFLQGKLVREHRYSSSALKFCVIARGEADIYPRFGPTCEWDTAAGHAILLAAGGSIETPDGKPLGYGKPDFLNGEFVAYGRR